MCARAYLDFVFISLVFCIIRERKSGLLCRRNVERIERDEAEKRGLIIGACVAVIVVS